MDSRSNDRRSDSDLAQSPQLGERVLASDALFRLSFEASPEAMALTRLTTGEVVAVNQEWEKLTGFHRSEVLGKPVQLLDFWPDERARQRSLSPLIEMGRLADTDVKLRMRDGEGLGMA